MHRNKFLCYGAFRRVYAFAHTMPIYKRERLLFNGSDYKRAVREGGHLAAGPIAQKFISAFSFGGAVLTVYGGVTCCVHTWNVALYR